MSTNVATLKLVVDSSGAVQGMGTYGDAVSKGGAAAEQAATGNAALRESLLKLKGIVAGLTVAGLTRQFLELSEAAVEVQSRLQFVVDAGTSARTMFQALAREATATDQRVGALADTYTDLYYATRELGLGQAQVLALTRTVAQSLQAMGRGVDESSAAVDGLARGLQQGAFDGLALKSILRDMPVLTQALAAGLGTTVSGLTRFAEAGELTAERVVQALNASSEMVAEAAARDANTIGDGMTALRNAVDVLVDSLGRMTGAGEGVAGVLGRLASFLSENTAAAETLVVVLGTAGVAGAAAVALKAFGQLASAQIATAFLGLVPAVTSVADALALASMAANGFWVAVTGPVGRVVAGVVAGLAALTAGVYAWRRSVQQARGDAEQFQRSLVALAPAQLSQQLASLESRRISLVRQLQQMDGGNPQRVQEVTKALAEVNDQLVTVTNAYRSAQKASEGTTSAMSVGATTLRKALYLAGEELKAWQSGGDVGLAAYKRAAETWAQTTKSAETFSAALRNGNAEARTLLALSTDIEQTNARLSALQDGSKDTRAAVAKLNAEKFKQAVDDVNRAIEQYNDRLDQSAERTKEWSARQAAGARAMDDLLGGLQKSTAYQLLENDARRKGAEELRKFQVWRAGELAVEQALAVARSNNLALTAQQLAAVREQGESLARTQQEGEKLVDQGRAQVGGANALRDALQDVLGVAQGIASVFGDQGRAIAVVLGGVVQIWQVLERARAAAKAADAAKTASKTADAGSAAAAGAGSLGAGAALGVAGVVLSVGASLYSAFATNARKQAQEAEQAAERFSAAMERFREAIRGPVDSVLQQIDRVDKALSDALAADAAQRSKTPTRQVYNVDTRLSDRRVAELGASYVRQLQAEMFRAIGQGWQATLAQIQQAYDEREAALRALYERAAISEADYQRALADSNTIRAQAVAQLEGERRALEARQQAEEARALSERRTFASNLDVLNAQNQSDPLEAERIRIREAAAQQVDSARALYDAGKITQGWFENFTSATLRGAELALQRATAAQAEAVQRQQEDLALRRVRATLPPEQADQEAQRIANRRELADASSDAVRAELAYIQVLEATQRAKEQRVALEERLGSLEQQRLGVLSGLEGAEGVRAAQELRALERASALAAARTAEEKSAIQRLFDTQDYVAARRAEQEAARAAMEAAGQYVSYKQAEASATLSAAEASRQAAQAARELASVQADLQVQLLRETGRQQEAARLELDQWFDQRRAELRRLGASATALIMLEDLYNAKLRNLLTSFAQTSGQGAKATPAPAPVLPPPPSMDAPYLRPRDEVYDNVNRVSVTTYTPAPLDAGVKQLLEYTATLVSVVQRIDARLALRWGSAQPTPAPAPQPVTWDAAEIDRQLGRLQMDQGRALGVPTSV
jgi:tape measure domain-containing protein